MALRPGETAPGIAKKQAAKRAVCRAIITVLDEALASPHKAPADVLAAFASYRKLSRWQDLTRGIKPMSENTLRKHLLELYSGGLKGFEQARMRLLREASAQPVKPGTKAAYKQSAGDLDAENQQLVNQILEFSDQYLDLLQTARDLATAHRFLQAELKAHTDKYPKAYQGFRVIRGDRDGK